MAEKAVQWNKSQWMADAWDFIKNRSIFEIALPGTHNSGSFVGIMETRCQATPIQMQLEGGIRALDLRVRPSHGPGKFAFYHEGFWYPEQDANFALVTIADFVERHSKEIIIIKLEIDQMSAEQEDEFTALVQTTIGSHLILDGRGGYAMTPNNFNAGLGPPGGGKNIILACKSDVCEKLSTPGSARRWLFGGAPADVTYGGDRTWWSSYSFFKRDGTQDNIDMTRVCIEGALLGRPLSPPQTDTLGNLVPALDKWTGFSVSEMNIWPTGGNIEAGAFEQQHPKLREWLPEWATNRRSNSPLLAVRNGPGGISNATLNTHLNIIQVDYFEGRNRNYRNSDVVIDILTLNEPAVQDDMATYNNRGQQINDEYYRIRAAWDRQRA